MLQRVYSFLYQQSGFVLILLFAILFLLPVTLFLEEPSVNYLTRIGQVEERLEESRLQISIREEAVRAALRPLLWDEVSQLYQATNGKLSKDILVHLVRESRLLNIPSDIIIGLIKVESDFDPKAIGPLTPYGRAYGLCQFMENTAPWIAEMAGLDYDFDLLFEPKYSITLAATYLNYLQYGDGETHVGYQNWHATLTAYNRGINGLIEYQKLNNTVVSTYSEKVLSYSP